MSKLKKLLICLSLSLGSCAGIKPAPVVYLYQMQFNPEQACYRMIITSQIPFTFKPDGIVAIENCDGLLGIATKDQPSMAAWIKYAQRKSK